MDEANRQMHNANVERDLHSVASALSHRGDNLVTALLAIAKSLDRVADAILAVGRKR